LRQVFICMRPRTPYPHTVYLFTQGSEGGSIEPERRVDEWATVHKAIPK
jgi:hypothetical protein